MGKNHLKRLAAQRTWDIRKKGLKFVTKPMPGPHSLDTGIPISVLLKEILNYASTTREAKKILNTNEMKVDGVARRDLRFIVGIFDIIEFANTKEYFRIMLNKMGKIVAIKINKEEASLKPCKIVGKTMVRGKLQLNLFDGKNILVSDNAYKISDSLLCSLPDQKISKHLKLDKNSTIFLIGGKHIGEVGNVEDVVEDRIIYKNQRGDLVETSKKYAFVIGGSKSLIRLE